MADLYVCKHGVCEPERGDCAECDKLLSGHYERTDARKAREAAERELREALGEQAYLAVLRRELAKARSDG
jgi:hypothetical protein